MALSSVGQAIPLLADLTPNPLGASSIGIGRQNFTHCCLRAMNDSLSIEHGNLTITNTSYFSPGMTASLLEDAISDGQFPCGATYNGNPAGAPVVQVPYSWCTSHCSGWEVSHFSNLNQWVGPLVSFILPSLAFCLNIPRSRKLAIPDIVFQAHPRNIVGLTTYWIRLLGALLLMTIDTMVWLSICFAFAGPMLLSAVHEFVLDRKILEFMNPPKKSVSPPMIPNRLKAQLLLAVVVGNIRISTGIDERRRSTLNSRKGSGMTMIDSEATAVVGPPVNFIDPATVDNTWKRIMVMIEDSEEPDEVGRGTRKGVTLATKLKALLNSQASFGSTVGAPILFFVGSFVYSVLSIEQTLGDDDQAHALAFGMWWITIPYLAIISCAMLASNEPSALQGIVFDGGARAAREKFEMSFWDKQKQKMREHGVLKVLYRAMGGYEWVEYTYDGQFKTVNVWNRGPNKRRWVQEAINDYTKAWNQHPDRHAGFITPEQLRDGVRMRFADRRNVLLGTLYLLLVPSVMAFLTSYNVPRKGLACRSLTYLVYAITQILEILLWIWEVWLKDQYGPRWSETKTPAKAINWWAQACVGMISIFAAVGGTLMQIVGVYHSCACKIPVQYWTKPYDPGSYIVLSTNTADSIVAAQEWWTNTGSVAVGLLGLMCSLAWWHQRRLRKVFRDEADSLDRGEEVKMLEGRSVARAGTSSSQDGELIGPKNSRL